MSLARDTPNKIASGKSSNTHMDERGNLGISSEASWIYIICAFPILLAKHHPRGHPRLETEPMAGSSFLQNGSVLSDPLESEHRASSFF